MKNQTTAIPPQEVLAAATELKTGQPVFTREAILAMAEQLKNEGAVSVEVPTVVAPPEVVAKAKERFKKANKKALAAQKAKEAKQAKPARVSRFGEGKHARTAVNYFEPKHIAEHIQKLAKKEGTSVSDFVSKIVQKAVGK